MSAAKGTAKRTGRPGAAARKRATTKKAAPAARKRAAATAKAPAKKKSATAVKAAAPRKRASSRAVSRPALAPLPPAPPFFDRGKPIPDLYGRDTLRLMARDPEWLFVYWEVTPQRMRQLQSRFPKLHALPWQVRLVDTQSNHTHHTPVFLGACNWYLPAKPRTAYRAELGFMDGSLFVKVLASNKTKTPADAMSDCGDEEWMVLRRDLMRMLHLQNEKDLFGPGRPFASIERFQEVSLEESVLLERLARSARSVGASTNVPDKPAT